MRFTSENRYVCMNVHINDDNKREDTEKIMIELYTPEREAGEPGGVTLNTKSMELFIHDDEAAGKL